MRVATGASVRFVEAIEGAHSDRLRTVTGKRLHSVRLTHRTQGNAHQEQRLAFDIDDAAAAGHPSVGRPAYIDEQQDGHVALRTLLRAVQRLRHRMPGVQVGPRIDAGLQIEFIAIELPAQSVLCARSISKRCRIASSIDRCSARPGYPPCLPSREMRQIGNLDIGQVLLGHQPPVRCSSQNFAGSFV
ncbi:hypothetical protein [Methyloversatilis sp. XJ19-49]|uniref:hypothetical protein n=1 Tax=Methyloversatilis sp. XJ19-49 TaxID=2963429 RepID=UPI00211CE0D7|nr:hypothetical protein [Methyloversatilis sp. XJ19-49]MCQ9379881.1 hypothetical protein [Methyloversatilis sp. XJ19-49]